jgi:hypothetical protein
MNTHVVHSLQYLQAILLEFHLRVEGKGPSDQLSSESRADLQRCLAGFCVGLGFAEGLFKGSDSMVVR